jgi:hypothetical protein
MPPYVSNNKKDVVTASIWHALGTGSAGPAGGGGIQEVDSPKKIQVIGRDNIDSNEQRESQELQPVDANAIMDANQDSGKLNLW